MENDGTLKNEAKPAASTQAAIPGRGTAAEAQARQPLPVEGSNSLKRRSRLLDDSVTPETIPPGAPSGRCLLPRAGAGGAPRGCEDAWSMANISLPCGTSLALYAVFDGHGGDSAARHAAVALPGHIESCLTASLSSSASAATGLPGALVAAFTATDGELAGLPLGSSSAGTTATVALVSESSLTLAWVGDSRAVVYGTQGIHAATMEHRASREDEQARINAAGGRVLQVAGMRVMGTLAVTRAIGDHDLRAYGVVPTPDVLHLSRTPGQEWLVLATDGLWDVMSNNDVLAYLQRAVAKVAERASAADASAGVACMPCQAAGVAARALAQCARRQRHSSDDITVLVVDLIRQCSCKRALCQLACARTSVTLEQRGSSARNDSVAASPPHAHGDAVAPPRRLRRTLELDWQQGAAGACQLQPPLPPAAPSLGGHAVSHAVPHASGSMVAAVAAAAASVSDLVLTSPFAGLLCAGSSASACSSSAASAGGTSSSSERTRATRSASCSLLLRRQASSPSPGGVVRDAATTLVAVAAAAAAAAVSGGAGGGEVDTQPSSALSGSCGCGLRSGGSLGSSMELPLTVT